MAEHIFDSMDKAGTGFVTKAQLEDEIKKYSGTGKISKQQLLDVFKNHYGLEDPTKPTKFFEALAKDGNLDGSDIIKIFEASDTGSGKMSKEEFMNAFKKAAEKKA